MSVKSLYLQVQTWLRNREAVRALSAKSDRDLAQLGLRRVEIEHAVKHGLAPADA